MFLLRTIRNERLRSLLNRMVAFTFVRIATPFQGFGNGCLEKLPKGFGQNGCCVLVICHPGEGSLMCKP